MNKENKTEEVFQCICGKQFKTSRSLGSHKNTCKAYQEFAKEQKLKVQQEKESRRLPNGLFKCENPDCNNEHDGTFGSGRFCCIECRRHYNSKIGNQTSIKNGTKKCPENFKVPRAPYGTWKCSICGEIFETRAKLYDHIHEVHPKPKGQPWNKNLTKETDERILKRSIKIKQRYKNGELIPSFKGRHLTKEHKDKIISTYVQNRTNNKYRGTYKGIYFQYSFELAWIVWNLEHNIPFFRCDESFEYFDSEQKKMRTYYPDFCLEDGTIVEIKGRIIPSVYDKQKAVTEIYHRKYLLLTKDKIQHCLDYCKQKYGNNFLQKLKDT